MTQPARGVFALGLLLPIVLALAGPTAKGDPYHLQVGNDTLVTGQEIYDQQWLAQSFVAPSRFLLSRLALYVRDRSPSEPLSLELRPDLGGFPAASSLTGTSADGPSSAGWVDFDVSPVLELEQNRTYWIVASTNAPITAGYVWWGSGINTAYPPGTGALAPDGINWTSATEDYAFRVYGFQQPILTFSVTASKSVLDVGQFVAFGVNLTNAGLGSAGEVWVNVTLPTWLAYVDDDAAFIGGVRDASLNFRFRNVTTGSWSFQITAVAKNNVPNGTVAETRFAFEATDHNGSPTTRLVENVAVTILNTGLVPSGMWWALGLAAAVLAAGLFLLLRGRRASVEEVFVVHQNGILLAHQSKTLTPDKDEDLLASMLKTVQDFVQEAFSANGPLPMRGIQFGEFNILIEHGRAHSVAVVYRGKDDGTLATRMKELSGLIETRFGNVLQHWTGDMREVRGLRDLLSVLWGRRPEAPQARTGDEDVGTRKRDLANSPAQAIAGAGERTHKSQFADEDG